MVIDARARRVHDFHVMVHFAHELFGFWPHCHQVVSVQPQADTDTPQRGGPPVLGIRRNNLYTGLVKSDQS